jgi:hypothetical protein
MAPLHPTPAAEGQPASVAAVHPAGAVDRAVYFWGRVDGAAREAQQVLGRHGVRQGMSPASDRTSKGKVRTCRANPWPSPPGEKEARQGSREAPGRQDCGAWVGGQRNQCLLAGFGAPVRALHEHHDAECP